jgi:CheY-like chemotaxis protein
MTTVLLVDDHPVVREGLRLMIDAEHDLTVVGEAGSGAEAIALAESLCPDVILMDLRMPDVDGVTATERILAKLPNTRIVVVTTYESDTDILRYATPYSARRCWHRRSPIAWFTLSANRIRSHCRHAKSKCSPRSPRATPTPTSAASCTSARRR